MKLLLVAVNAKYIHSNLAVYSLRAYAGAYSEHIKIVEMTINNSEEEILKAIYTENAEVVAFSCYIWNISMVQCVAAKLRKVQPQVKIWFGGPEVSYDACQCLERNAFLDGIMLGEGEQTFLELTEYYVEEKKNLEEIAGLAFRESATLLSAKVPLGVTYKQELPSTQNDQLIMTPERGLIPLDSIPFPYQSMVEFKNRIIYYESSRGCPFTCSYCLSSIDKTVRLRSTDLVKKELKKLLDYQVPQVKFVDRTFNCNKKHSMEIWRFLKENDNGITNFHFEISADLLTDEEIDFLSSLRPGQVQFEIGIQSTNSNTIKAICRRMDLDKLKNNVARIKAGNNIHQHLDLIAGLPLEDEKSFEQSFNEVYRMKPDQLQLGFLKVLKGSLMEKEREGYGIVCSDEPPYEVLRTGSIDYATILKLKGICEMVEIYYNSAQFTNSIGFLEYYYASPMKLYLELYDYYELNKLDSLSHSRMRRYEILLDFYREVAARADAKQEPEALPLFSELLLYDLFLRENLKTRPAFAPVNPLQERLRELYHKYNADRGLVHIEQFHYDVIASVREGKVIKSTTTILFDYNNRDPLSKAAGVTIIEPGEDERPMR
jgi:radical SAM superfamily enzyme YgiQ (UPF0313 family)